MQSLRLKAGTGLVMLLALLACQPLHGGKPAINTPDGQLQELLPSSKGILPGSKGISTQGQVGIQFDLGQTLTPADFEKITQAPFTHPPLGFKLLQTATAANFSLADIASATVTMVSPLVENPATATLTSKDIAQGWSVLFEDIPAGPVVVTLEIKGKNGQALLTERRDVDVIAGHIVPVNFTLELAGGSSCQAQCAGSVRVTVNAVTACFGQVAVPVTVRAGEKVSARLLELQGQVERFEVNFGDGSPIQSVQALPVDHAYATPGRYPVTVTLAGNQCKNPYTSRAFISVLQ